MRWHYVVKALCRRHYEVTYAFFLVDILTRKHFVAQSFFQLPSLIVLKIHSSEVQGHPTFTYSSFAAANCITSPQLV